MYTKYNKWRVYGAGKNNTILRDFEGKDKAIKGNS
jgi:hypothetical protein